VVLGVVAVVAVATVAQGTLTVGPDVQTTEVVVQMAGEDDSAEREFGAMETEFAPKDSAILRAASESSTPEVTLSAQRYSSGSTVGLSAILVTCRPRASRPIGFNSAVLSSVRRQGKITMRVLEGR
jgi:hypothetical protein